MCSCWDCPHDKSDDILCVCNHERSDHTYGARKCRANGCECSGFVAALPDAHKITREDVETLRSVAMSEYNGEGTGADLLAIAAKLAALLPPSEKP